MIDRADMGTDLDIRFALCLKNVLMVLGVAYLLLLFLHYLCGLSQTFYITFLKLSLLFKIHD